MKKTLKIIAVLIFVVFAGLQFIRPDKINPPIIESETLESSTKVPVNISEMLKRSCKDCHSNTTDYPWYSNVSPMSWKVVEHIDEGRDELNFSKWNTYSKERKLRKLEQVCDEVKGGSMPHNQYLWIHWDAALSDDDKQNLCDWTVVESKRIIDEG